jgi:hypothetical protein
MKILVQKECYEVHLLRDRDENREMQDCESVTRKAAYLQDKPKLKFKRQAVELDTIVHPMTSLVG